jgi:hypothetical protein
MYRAMYCFIFVLYKKYNVIIIIDQLLMAILVIYRFKKNKYVYQVKLVEFFIAKFHEKKKLLAIIISFFIYFLAKLLKTIINYYFNYIKLKFVAIVKILKKIYI